MYHVVHTLCQAAFAKNCGISVSTDPAKPCRSLNTPPTSSLTGGAGSILRLAVLVIK